MEVLVSDFSLGLGLFQLSLLIIAIFPLVALISILKNEFPNNDKLIWILVTLFLPLIGALLYFLIGRKNRLKKTS
ncbi:MAG: PLD nuclease N-terminal domain-containing protein [Jejuia sp.]